MPATADIFPINPLSYGANDAVEYNRRLISGILESYHSNYDILAEMLQNAMDAVEDAVLRGLTDMGVVRVTVDLPQNAIEVLDNGVGMTADQFKSALTPSISFKGAAARMNHRPYRGYKGVGLTFIAFGTDDITIHSRAADEGPPLAGRMRYGRKWADREREEPPWLALDDTPSPLARQAHGTYVRVVLSGFTRPRSLAHIANDPKVWETILRTRTAVGQVDLGAEPASPCQVILRVIGSDGAEDVRNVPPVFLWPDQVERTPPIRCLDVAEYWRNHGSHSDIPVDFRRRDAISLRWTTDEILAQLGTERQEPFVDLATKYRPALYAYLPYQGSIWSDINETLTGRRSRSHMVPGLVVASNNQRVADISDIKASRFETLSRNLMVVVHFNDAPPHQGRKTLQEEVMTFAHQSADRALQYLARHREFLRPAGESPTPQQRDIERNHQDWQLNVTQHALNRPLDIPPICLVSEPLHEQDVVGLFHQLAARGVFCGLRVYATSQSHTYDCLVEYDVAIQSDGVRYSQSGQGRLGLSPYVLGDGQRFVTRRLTAEFKNNLDGLIADIAGDGPKSYGSVDICVCWSAVDEVFPGYELKPIIEHNIDERAFPGVTHTLRRDGEQHMIQVIMLKVVVDLVQSGGLELP